MVSTTHDVSHVFIELGAAIVGLAILARLANRLGFSAIPLYLLAGLAFGNGGLALLDVSESFIHIGAEIGVLLLLFMLGLEYTGEELKHYLKIGLPAGAVDFALNVPPGLTYISSSGIIAKVLGDLKRLNNAETPSVLCVLVLEDLAMAVYLPLVAVLLVGGGPQKIALSVSVALVTVSLVLLIAVRFGTQISEFASHESDEIILLTAFGTMLLVAGLASGCRYQPRSERFSSASRCPVPLPRSPSGFSPRCATCSPRPSSFSLDYRLTRQRCHVPCL